jgi:hypothetical protein
MYHFHCYQSVWTSMKFQVIHIRLILKFWQCINIIRDTNFCLIFVLHGISATNSWTLFTHWCPHERELLTHMIIKSTPNSFLSFLFDTPWSVHVNPTINSNKENVSKCVASYEKSVASTLQQCTTNLFCTSKCLFVKSFILVSNLRITHL